MFSSAIGYWLLAIFNTYYLYFPFICIFHCYWLLANFNTYFDLCFPVLLLLLAISITYFVTRLCYWGCSSQVFKRVNAWDKILSEIN